MNKYDLYAQENGQVALNVTIKSVTIGTVTTVSLFTKDGKFTGGVTKISKSDTAEILSKISCIYFNSNFRLISLANKLFPFRKQ